MVDESVYKVPGQAGFENNRDDRPIPTNKRMGGPVAKGPAPARGTKRQSSGPSGYANMDFQDPVNALNNAAQRFEQPQQPKAPGMDRFGGLKPFEIHHIPEEMKDHFAYQGHAQQDGQDHPPPDWHMQNYPNQAQFKDPDVWDPPTPPRGNPVKKSSWSGQ